MNDLFSIVPAQGKTDTSAEAADKISITAGTLRHEVLLVLEKFNGSTSPIALHLKKPYSGIQPRTSELAKHGYITDSGGRWRNEYGNNEIVWTITDKGRAAI